VPAGVREGSRIRLAGKGEPGRRGGPPGDLYLITHVASSPVFKRKGNNLEVEVPLTIPEALPGAEGQGPTPEGPTSAARRAGARVKVSATRGVFMISVAAELAQMHPQTLRIYEARGLIEPKRSPKGTRLYSQEDVQRLRRIQEMTAELGLNLAGVERVLDLEE